MIPFTPLHATFLEEPKLSPSLHINSDDGALALQSNLDEHFCRPKCMMPPRLEKTHLVSLQYQFVVIIVAIKERNVDDEKFWTDLERQYFMIPNPSLVQCLQSHVWHCETIAKIGLQHLSKSQKKNGVNLLDYKSVTFPLKPYVKFPEASSLSDAGPLENLLNNEAISFFSGEVQSLSSLSSSDAGGVDEYFNALENGKHVNRQRLPNIQSHNLPDAVHLTIYCPENMDVNPNVETPVPPPPIINDYMKPNQVPEIIYGPSPTWARGARARFKAGKVIGKRVPLGKNINNNIGWQVYDPVWKTRKDIDDTAHVAKGTSDLAIHHKMCEALATCQIDYSPSLYAFTEFKPAEICRRCLGMPRVACAWCKLNVADSVGGVCFSSKPEIEFKYQMSYNRLHILNLRNLMTERRNLSSATNSDSAKEINVPCPADNVLAVLYNYLKTLKSLGDIMRVLLKRVKSEHRPDYNRWSQIETRMLETYLQQYHSKQIDSRYAYTTQMQSLDVLRLRVSCKNSSSFPVKWTDHALCNVCGSDEDWDDDPILFCDCCYLPMHFCCLGYKAGTLNDVVKINNKNHLLASGLTPTSEVADEDEWLCPGCCYLINQVAYSKEETMFAIARAVTGPRNRQLLEMLQKDNHPWGPRDIDALSLPYIVGFEYDDIMERSLCVLQSLKSSETADSKEESAMHLIQGGNTPALLVTPVQLQCPFTANLTHYQVEYFKRNHQYLDDWGDFSDMVLGSFDQFSDEFAQALHSQDFRKLSQYVAHIPKADAQIQRQASTLDQLPRCKYSVKRHKTIMIQSDKSLRRATTSADGEGEGDFINRDDIYTICCRNPLKKLVVSVKCSDELWANLRVPVCIFCGFDAYYPGGGPIKRTSNPGTWGHVKCALGLEVVVKEREIDYTSFVPKIKSLRCIICHQWSNAIIQCSHSTCCRAFHIPCAAASTACLFAWDTTGKPDVLCPLHASGLAPTVVLRKLQNKVQYKLSKRVQNLETSIEGLNPKDNIYLDHLLTPNYRCIANMVERVLGANHMQLYRFAFQGDVKYPAANNSGHSSTGINPVNINGVNASTPRGTNLSNVQSSSGKCISKRNTCPYSGIVARKCVWCILDLDGESHFRPMIDDKCPTLDYIGDILFPNFKETKRKVSKPFGRFKRKREAYEATSGVVANVFDSVGCSVDAKMLRLVANDFIGGKRLLSEAEFKIFRCCLDGLLRVVYTVYGVEIKEPVIDNLSNLFKHVERIREFDRYKLHTKLNNLNGSNNNTSSSNTNSTRAANLLGTSSLFALVPSNIKLPRPNIEGLLSELNSSVFHLLDSEHLPSFILRNFNAARPGDDTDSTSVTYTLAVSSCQGCLDLHANEHSVQGTKRRRPLQSVDFKTCCKCNARACGTCLEFAMGAILNSVLGPKARGATDGHSGNSIEDNINNKKEEDEDYDDCKFKCARCSDMDKDPQMPLLCCMLCSRFDGLLARLPREHIAFPAHWLNEYNGIAYVHLLCLDWLCCTRTLTDGLKRLSKTMFDHRCHYCGISCGATLGCVAFGCNVRFHASCGAQIGCKVDVGKKVDTGTISRKVYCLRHTLLQIAKIIPSERKFIVAPTCLYELVSASRLVLNNYIKGIYISQYCINAKLKWDSKRYQSLSRRNKAIEAFNEKLTLLSNTDYIHLGLVPCKPKATDTHDDDSCKITEEIARDRLIQAMNYAALNGMAMRSVNHDKKQIKLVMTMLRNGQLKPIAGTRRGRKPKSLDGSQEDLRIHMSMEDILTHGHSGQLSNGDYYCPVCFCVYFEKEDSVPGDDLHWIGCDQCERWFHFVCAGVWSDRLLDDTSDDKWFCPTCKQLPNQNFFQ